MHWSTLEVGLRWLRGMRITTLTLAPTTLATTTLTVPTATLALTVTTLTLCTAATLTVAAATTLTTLAATTLGIRDACVVCPCCRRLVARDGRAVAPGAAVARGAQNAVADQSLIVTLSGHASGVGSLSRRPPQLSDVLSALPWCEADLRSELQGQYAGHLLQSVRPQRPQPHHVDVQLHDRTRSADQVHLGLLGAFVPRQLDRDWPGQQPQAAGDLLHFPLHRPNRSRTRGAVCVGSAERAHRLEQW